MISLSDLFHDAATFIALEPEDVAAVLMEAAQRRQASSSSETGWPIFFPAAIPYATHSSGNSPDWPAQVEQPVRFALAEAVGWLKRDRSLPPGEQEAEAALFSGALGHGRNPVSHRDVDMTPTEAARLILLASHLLSIVEKRTAVCSEKSECT